MNFEVKRAILDKIKSYDRIILTRHFRPDGDAIGSTKGLQEILKLSFPEKEVYLINEDYSDALSFLGGEDAPIDDALYADALVIILDCAGLGRVSNKKCTLAKEIIKIDHHINVSPYGSLSWVEEDRSSACEMIVDFYRTFSDELKMNQAAATYLFTGMVTDSGRFKYESVTGDTLRCAALLLDQGVNTQALYAHMDLKDFSYYKFQAYALQNMEITENGVAYLYMSQEIQDHFHLTHEQASTSVSFLDGILGSIIWLAFIDNGDGSIRVRVRSRFVTTNHLAEKYHGGGHACASGATVYSQEEMQAMLADADALIKEYKQTQEGWL